MPGLPPPVADERTGLLAFLDQQRYVLKLAAHGLTDNQARMRPTPSALSVGGLVKHVALTESDWIDTVAGTRGHGEVSDYVEGFTMREDETLDGLLSAYDEVAARTAAVIGARGLDDPVPVPKDAPWFPKDVDAWSVRWVMLHLIEETARHAGHADIVREAVDGATAFPLMAAAEGWPETPWMKPWRPRGG